MSLKKVSRKPLESKYQLGARFKTIPNAHLTDPLHPGLL